MPLGETTAKGVIVVRLAAPLFFANGTVFSDAVKRAIRAVPEGSVHHLVVDMEAVTDIDVTAAEAFTSLHEWLDSKQIELSFSRVRLQALSQAHAARPGRRRPNLRHQPCGDRCAGNDSAMTTPGALPEGVPAGAPSLRTTLALSIPAILIGVVTAIVLIGLTLRGRPVADARLERPARLDGRQ